MTKFQAGTVLINQVKDCQVHATGKAIRPLFADPVTYLRSSCIFIGDLHSISEEDDSKQKHNKSLEYHGWLML